MNPREEIAHLTEVLERANHQYYVLDAPEMEDYEYDRLLRRKSGRKLTKRARR